VRYKKKSLKPINVLVPGWIAPVEELVSGTDLSVSRMQIVLHNFYLCMILSKYKNKELFWSEQGFFPVHNSILQQIAGSNYREYVTVLENKGVIDRRRNTIGGKNYLPGVHSQLYRFIRPEGVIYFRKETVNDYRCIKSVLRTRDRYAIKEYNDAKHMAMNQTHLRLREFLDECYIDVPTASDIKEGFGSDAEHYPDLDMDYFRAINEGDIKWFTVDGFGERCHTHITNLKSRYRPALRFRKYSDQSLVHIDIKNSQPYFSAALAANDSLIDDLLPEFKALKPLISAVTAMPDNKSYFDLCSSGLLYEYMGNPIGKDRNQVKRQFFRAVLFSKNLVYGEDRVMMEIFKKSFPSVSKLFSSIKKLTEVDLPELKDIIKEKRAKYTQTKNSHKILSCAMQRLESRLITQHIAGKLINMGIGPFLTIHDSFLVLPQHQQTTVQCIEDTCRSFGIEPPRLSIEQLDDLYTTKSKR
jgi:hypothetical protein